MDKWHVVQTAESGVLCEPVKLRSEPMLWADACKSLSDNCRAYGWDVTFALLTEAECAFLELE